MRWRDLIAIVAGVAALPLAAHAQQPVPSIAQPNGAALYSQYCSQCHDAANSRAPGRSLLQSMTLEEVLKTLSTGSMASIAQDRTNVERTAIASFITGKGSEGSRASTDISGQCVQNPVGFPQRLDGPRWNGWGADIGNSRFQPAAMAGLTQDQVPLLHLKWAFGFLGRSAAVAQPTIVGGLVFVGGGDREVYALDAKTGCTRWTFKTEAVVRTAINFAPISGTDQFAVFFGDVGANAYAVNAITAALVYRGSHRVAVGLPMLHLSRQRRRAGYCDGQADLEELHYPRGAASDKAECRRDPTLRSVWRGGVVLADHRCPASGALCRDRGQLFRPSLGNE